MVPVVKSYPHASQNSASAVFGVAQFGQGWVAEMAEVAGVPPLPSLAAPDSVPDVTGADSEREGLFASGADWPIGAPHVSQ